MKRKQEKLTQVGKQLERELNPETEDKEEATEESEKVEKTAKKEKAEKAPGRDWTLSIALPGSILDNAQSPELRYIFAQKSNSEAFLEPTWLVKSPEQSQSSKLMKSSSLMNLATLQRVQMANLPA